MRHLPLLLLCSGCWLTGAEVDAVIDGPSDADTDTDTDADADTDVDIEVVLETDQGTAGDFLVITGGPFGDDLEVTIGDDPATIEDSGDTEIRVIVPAGDEGFVDVVVHSDGLEVPASDPWFRWEDATGETAAIGVFSWWDYVGGYWEDGATDSGEGTLKLVHPAATTVSDLLGPDGCTFDFTADWDAPAYPAVAENLTLRGPNSRVIELTADGSGTWTAADIRASEWTSGEYLLRSDGLDGEYPAFETSDLLRIPESFAVLSPAITGNEAPTLYPGFEVRWSTSGSADFVVIEIYRYDGGELAEIATCVTEDDGSFETPGLLSDPAFASWSLFGDQITLLVGRVRTSEATLPNHGTAEVAGVRWAVGAGFQGIF